MLCFFHPTSANTARIFSFFFLLLFSPNLINSAHAKPVTAHEVKAALMIKFTDFIRWPAASFSEEPDTFVLGILGCDFFDDLFDSFIGKKIQGKTFKVKHFQRVEDIGQVQILFISFSEENYLCYIFDALKGRDILTIGDTPGFAESGGIVNFINKKGSVGFKINVDAVNRTNLKISSHLLRLADIVSDGDTKE